MQGIIYVRVSSAEQVSGTSLASQEQECRRYCAANNIAVLEVFREEGESAKTADRTALLRALDFCRKHRGGVTAFVVAKVDRFARNTEDHFYVRRLLLDNGVTLHSVSEPIGNRPTEKFVETVLAAGAEFDNAIRKQRCTDGLIGRINQGIWPLKPPLGYLCAHHRKHGEKKTRPDDPDPATFPVVQQALRAYQAGEVRTLSGLVAKLDELGLATLRGRPTKLQLADSILGRYLDFYAGVLVNPWTDIRQPGKHTPMISERDAQHIRLIRAGRLKPWVTQKDRFNAEFPLRHSVRCASCSHRFTGGFSRGRSKRYPYYFCANRACSDHGRTVPRAHLHQHFDNLLDSILPVPAIQQTLRDSIKDALTTQHTILCKVAEQSRSRLADLNARKRRVFEMREDGTYTPEQFLERHGAVAAEIALITAELSTAEFPPVSLDVAFEALDRFCRNLRSHWHDLPVPARVRFEQTLLPKGVAYERNRGIRTPELGPVFSLIRRAETTKSLTVDWRGDTLNQIADSLNEIIGLDKDLAVLLSEKDVAGQMTAA